MFWLVSLCVVLAAGLWVLWPLLSGDSRFKVTGLMVMLALPLLVYWQYQIVGSPRAMQEVVQTNPESTDASLDELVVSLRAKLTETAADLEGWVLLGRTYKTMQDYPAALAALETANRLVPDVPAVWVELVEARLFASGNPEITEDMVQLLEEAVARQPDLQKGRWLLGLAAAQRGDDAQAISHWRQLLQSMEPGSPVAQSVQAQIGEAEARLLAATVIDTEEADTRGSKPQWRTAGIEVDLSPEARETINNMTENSALFLIARAPGQNAGPPLAVKRIMQPGFPMQLSLSDADSMMPERPVSGFATLELQARLSISGEAMAASGDWQSGVTTWSADETGTVELTLGERIE